jgi:potassium channel subfamily K protein 9
VPFLLLFGRLLIHLTNVTEMRTYLLRRYNISDADYKLIETVIIESRPHKAGPQWKFSGAFYFAIVVVAVIGYGHSTPATISGKAFCIAYAMIGIPLGIFMFQSIGERLNKLISVIIRKFKVLLLLYLICK